jgi:hypothetical protein
MESKGSDFQGLQLPHGSAILYAATRKTYASKAAADGAALLMGLRWLELRAANGLNPFAEPLEEGVDRVRYPFRLAVFRQIVEQNRHS